ncbi:MAG: Haloalkane dehalogenase [Phycisphaerae bacterium]|nr:Haloalkane dehalogenase [Phycisphaerae bacterium]
MDIDRSRFVEFYPFSGHTLDLAGLRLHYLDEGAGDPVVCVHGNPTWSLYFRRLVLELRRDHRVIVPDHIGCGLSDKPGDDRYEYRLARRVDDLCALLEHLDIRRSITLVVHDWGGMIGLAAAMRSPQRIARLIVMNTAAFPLPAGRRLPWRLRVIRDWPVFREIAVLGFNAFAVLATRMATARGLSPALRRAYTAPYDCWAHRIATLRFVQDIPLSPADPSYALLDQTQRRLGELSGVPMLILWGLRDFVFDHAFLAEWQRRFPAAEVHTYADAGHYVLEDAADECVARVRAFVDATPLAGTADAPALRVSR